MSVKQVYESRRSVNFFDPKKEVSREVLKEIIDLAVLAPSAFNLQPWRIIAVTSPEKKELLKANANNQPKVTDAPVSLILVGDKTAYRAENPVWDELKSMVGEEGANGAQGAAAFLYGSTPERQLKFAESNTGLLAMSIMYAAKSFGVDTHAMSGIDFDGIKSAFNLEPNEEVVMVITVGHFDEEKELYDRRSRRGFDEIVSFE
jgi:nitroreductase